MVGTERPATKRLKFVRQVPIGRYYADFACRDERLVVEVDGSQHQIGSGDERRDAFMVTNGWSVLRFWNTDVFNDRAAVLETIVAVLEKRMAGAMRSADLTFIPGEKR